MGPLDLVIHLLNFIAPAVFVALLVTLAARFLMKKSAAASGWRLTLAMNFAACLLASVAGLLYFGQDGRLATYAALVVACATSQWLLVRGWRRQ